MIVAQGLHRDIDADLIAVLEAVGDRLRGRVDTDFDLLEAVCLDSFRQGQSREAGDAKRRVFEPRLPGLLGQSDPNLGRVLCRQFVKAQRGEQAEDTCGYALGYMCKRMLGRERMPARNIDSPSLSLDQAIADQTVEYSARDAAGLAQARIVTDDPGCSNGSLSSLRQNLLEPSHDFPCCLSGLAGVCLGR